LRSRKFAGDPLQWQVQFQAQRRRYCQWDAQIANTAAYEATETSLPQSSIRRRFMSILHLIYRKVGGWLTLVLMIALLPAPGARMERTLFASGADDEVLVYADGLASGWQDWSWDAAIRLDADAPVQSGSASLAVTYTQPWAGLSLRAPTLLDGALYHAITFWIHGGESGARRVRFSIQQSDSGGQTPAVAIEAPANQWSQVSISLSELGDPAAIARLNWQDDTGSSQPTFYLDNVALARAAPTPGVSGTIRIDTAGAPITVDRRILGTNLPTWPNPTRLEDPVLRARLVAAGLTVIRMPGGSWSNSYGWLSCEQRANQPNALPCGSGWESWAARPSDFINFLNATGAKGMWVVSPNGTPQEAAAVVAFFNAQPGDPTIIGVDSNGFDWRNAGYWAQLRADHGNAQPVGVHLWAVGNEVYGGRAASGGARCQSYGWEDVWTCDGSEYVNGARGYAGYTAFRTAMQAIDPTIAVGAVGLPFASEYNGWGSDVIAAAGDTMDFYDIHQYAFFEPPASLAVALAQPQSIWPSIRADLDAAFASHAAGRPIPVGVTEWNLFSVQEQDNGQLLTRAVNALFLADTIGQMVQHGIVLANQWDLANGRAGNGTEYGLLHEDSGWYRSPQYYVFPLWSRFGGEMLPTTSTFDAATQLSVYGGRVDETTISLLAINKSGAPVTATVYLDRASGLLPITGGTADILQAASLAAQGVTFNGQSNPAHDLSDAPPAPLARAGDSLQYHFAPHSVTLLRLILNGATGPTATPTATSTAEQTPIGLPTDPPSPTPESPNTPTPLPPTREPEGETTQVFVPLISR
jgi:hypothetical protein